MSKKGLFSKLNSLVGKKVNIHADIGDGNVLDVNGEVHKHDDRHWITTDKKSGNRVEIETERKGSIWTWRGTYLEHSVKTIESGKEVLNLTISDNSKISVNEVQDKGKVKGLLGKDLNSPMLPDLPKFEIDFSDRIKDFDFPKKKGKK